MRMIKDWKVGLIIKDPRNSVCSANQKEGLRVNGLESTSTPVMPANAQEVHITVEMP